jgi:tetratricopeptide (TPR) repeat protein
VLYRRAVAFWKLGRYEDVLTDLRRSIRLCHRQGDLLWEGRGHVLRGDALTALGRLDEADAELAEAIRVLTPLDTAYEANIAIHNRANVAFRRGELAVALELMDRAGEYYRQHDMARPALVVDHAEVLLSAGLIAEARDLVERNLTASRLPPVQHAELLLTAAQAALAAGDHEAAQRNASRAARQFEAQLRPTWAHRAQLLATQTQYLAVRAQLRNRARSGLGHSASSPPVTRRRLRRLLRISGETVVLLTNDHAPELAVAQVLHGRIAHDLGRDDEAAVSFEQAAQARTRGTGLAKAAGWLAAALLADLRDDRRALLHACRAGLDAVDEHRALMGDLELRALASRHGNELATLAFHSMAAKGDARGMLWWIERWRATGLSATPVKPPTDARLERDLAALRDVTRRLETLLENDPLAASLRQERTRREGVVRSTFRRQRGGGVTGPHFDIRRVLQTLGTRQLVALVEDDEALHCLVVSEGRVRRRPMLSMPEAMREAHFAKFALRRAAYGRVSDLDAVGRRLQSALLGTAHDLEECHDTVVVPPASLLTAPWGLLPALRDQVLAVVPSATLWATAASAEKATGHIALVTGPDLSTGESEVTELSPLHDDARSIAGDDATVDRALEFLDGARLAHIAAHGTFRADAPLFSSLKLADGPLTMHDLERLDRPPRAMVLSSCDTGDAAPIGAYEALGLVSSLLAMGTATVLASVVPVNDRATVGVMRTVHDVVGRGGSLAEGWLAARQTADDPLSRATAAAFTAWGA